MKKKDSDLKACSASPPHLTRKRDREHHSLLYQNPFDCMLVLGGKCSETCTGACVAPAALTLQTVALAASLPSSLKPEGCTNLTLHAQEASKRG